MHAIYNVFIQKSRHLNVLMVYLLPSSEIFDFNLMEY